MGVNEILGTTVNQSLSILTTPINHSYSTISQNQARRICRPGTVWVYHQQQQWRCCSKQAPSKHLNHHHWENCKIQIIRLWSIKLQMWDKKYRKILWAILWRIWLMRNFQYTLIMSWLRNHNHKHDRLSIWRKSRITRDVSLENCQ